MPSLILLDDETGGRVYPINRTTLVMGRSEASGLQLSGEEISPDHAVILRHGSALVLQDSGSASGTFVNGERVQRIELNHGDVLRLGGYRFTVDTSELGSEDKALRKTALLEVPGPPSTGRPSTKRVVAIRANDAKQETARLSSPVGKPIPVRAIPAYKRPRAVVEETVQPRGVPVALVVGIVVFAVVLTAVLVAMILSQ